MYKKHKNPKSLRHSHDKSDKFYEEPKRTLSIQRNSENSLSFNHNSLIKRAFHTYRVIADLGEPLK